MPNKFILFEGTDGSGKTSLAKEMAKQLNGIYYYNPPEIIRPLRKYADNSTYEIRLQYYLLGNHIANEEIKKLLENNHVICDWYIYSTIAYHSVLLKRKIEIPDILLPDKIVFVSAKWNEIEKRLEKRKNKSKFENIDFLKKVYQRYEEIFSQLDNVVKINTTDKQPTEIIKKNILLL